MEGLAITNFLIAGSLINQRNYPNFGKGPDQNSCLFREMPLLVIQLALIASSQYNLANIGKHRGFIDARN